MHRSVPLWILLLLLSFAPSCLHADEHVIRYGLVPDAAPTTFVDSQGTPTGFYIELFSRIIEELGYKTEFVVAPFPELWEMILDDEIDFFSSLVRNEAREDIIYWPEEPTAVGWGQYFLPKNRSISGIQELDGMKIGLVTGEANGDNFIGYMNGLKVEFEAVYFSDFDELMNAVIKEDVFGGVASNAYLLGKPEVHGTSIVFTSMAAFSTCSVSNTGMIPVVDAISSRLRNLKEDPDSYYWSLYDKWMTTERIETTVMPSWLIWLLGVLIAAVFVAWIFIRTLRDQVDTRTRELSDLNRDLENRVTERTKDLENAHDRLLDAERTSLTSRLVAGVAHQINTPLGIAMTASSFLRSEIENLHNVPNVAEEEDLAHIDQAVTLVEGNLNKVNNLVKSFRNLSSENFLDKPTLIQADQFIRDFITTLEGEFKKTGCRYELDLEPAILPATPMALSVIIAQLVTNALWHGYSEAPGTVTIRTRTEGSEVVISIEDTGRGIKPPDHSNVMEPFFTTDRSGRRAGLGLNIVESAVHDVLEGRLEVETSPDGITRATVIARAGE